MGETTGGRAGAVSGSTDQFDKARAFLGSFFCNFLVRFLGALWGAFWSIFGSKSCQKVTQKWSEKQLDFLGLKKSDFLIFLVFF